MNLSHKPKGASDKPIKLEGPCFNYFKATHMGVRSLSVMETSV